MGCVYGVIFTPGTRRCTNSAATCALERPTSFFLHRARGPGGRCAAPGPRGASELRVGHAPEQELAVQVGHVDLVEVDDVDVAETGEGQVLQHLGSAWGGVKLWVGVSRLAGRAPHLAAQAARPDDQDLGRSELLQVLRAGEPGRVALGV